MYGKIFEQIFESTVIELPLHARFVWVALLVICDRDGIVDATPESIARRINIPIDQVNDAIVALCQPDGRSRSPEEEGRRLVPIRSSYGWRIVNYAKYREMQREEDRRGYQRNFMRKRRGKARGVSTALAPVSSGKQSLGRLADSRGNKQKAEAEAEAEAKAGLEPKERESSTTRGRAKERRAGTDDVVTASFAIASQKRRQFEERPGVPDLAAADPKFYAAEFEQAVGMSVGAFEALQEKIEHAEGAEQQRRAG